MSETKSQPTPETDAVFAPCLYIEDITESEAKALLDKSKELEISRDQWKAVAERLAGLLRRMPHGHTRDCSYDIAGTSPSSDFCSCGLSRRYTAVCVAITEFNQLKESK